MVDSFNVPIYHPISAELEALVRRNGQFTIEKVDQLVRPSLEKSPRTNDAIVLHLRATWEGLIKAHFGNEIIDPLFQQFKKRVDESSILCDSNYRPVTELFFLLKRL